jgi:Arc/MetJ-type ribon-helix-helix transcriptional regulator
VPPVLRSFDILGGFAHRSAMQVELPPSQEEFIKMKIAHGAFSSPDALISEAINLLQQRDLWTRDAAAKIEQGWTEAKSGLLLSEETLIRHLNARKAAWKTDRPQR